MKLDMRKKQEKKETTKVTKKLPMTAKMKRAMAVYVAMVLIMTAGASTVFAADDPLTVINNLSTFIFGLILWDVQNLWYSVMHRMIIRLWRERSSV